jgi:hypothetical protein
MRKSVHLRMTLVTLGILFGCVSVSFGQNDGEVIMVGGYRTVASDDKEAVSAARFAIRAQKRRKGGPLSLVSIERAERQTVAGTNYKLCLQVKAADEMGNGVEIKDVEVVVFEPLPVHGGKKKYGLTSWKEEDCGGSD